MGSIVDASSAAVISSKETSTEEILIKKKPTVVFVLGGPGGGKSTQCGKIAKAIGYTHLSSGELLREASKLDPQNGPMIESMIKEGLSVSADYTMKIIQKAMEESKNDKFLLDGFPRDEEIRAAFEAAANVEPELVLFFNCSEEEREKRILSRKQGRVDDNAESVRKRFIYFEEHTLPVVDYYRSKEKVTVIDASKPKEEVFVTVKSCLKSLNIHSENAMEAEAEAATEVESKTSAEDEVLAVAEDVPETGTEAVIEDESKSSAKTEVLEVAEDVTGAVAVAEVEDKAVVEVEPESENLDSEIMKLKL